jgi:ferrous iron transport protein B
MIGIPFIPTVGPRGTGIRELFDKVIEVHEGRDTVTRHVHVGYGMDIERSIEKIESALCRHCPPEQGLSPRYLAVKLLEKDRSTGITSRTRKHHRDYSRRHGKVESEAEPRKTAVLIADAKWVHYKKRPQETTSRGPPERTASDQLMVY